MNKISILILILFSTSLFADMTIVEQERGKLVLKITAEELTFSTRNDSLQLRGNGDAVVIDSESRELPAFRIPLFMENPQNASISISINSKSVQEISRPVSSVDETPIMGANKIVSVILGEQFREVKMYCWYVTPVISITNTTIEQFTEAIVTITYDPVRNLQRAAGDYERTIAKSALNPDEFSRVYTPQVFAHGHSVRSVALGNSYLGADEVALQFTVEGDEKGESEADGSIDRVVRITPTMISSDLGDSIPFDEIRIMSSNPMVFDTITPHISNIPTSLVDVPLLEMDYNDNGRFDGDDELIFFASGCNFWYFENNKWKFNYNDHSIKRHYYITRNSTSNVISQIDQPSPGATTVTSGMQFKRVQQRTFIVTASEDGGHSSRVWRWGTFGPSSNRFVAPNPLQFTLATGTPKVRLFATKRSSFSAYVHAYFLFDGGDSLHILKDDMEKKWNDAPLSGGFLTVGMNNLREAVPDGYPKRADFFDLGGYDIRYRRKLSVGNSSIRFFSDSSKGIVTYQLSDLPNEMCYIFRINSLEQRIELVDTVEAGGEYSFTDSTGVGYEYYISPKSNLKTPSLTIAQTQSGSDAHQVRDLHASSNFSDYMIVTPKEFLSQAVELAQHKVETGRFFSPTVVTVEDIYREFSGGVVDPTAIRNFMSYVHQSWERAGSGDTERMSPDYLVLLGIGHYNFKGENSSTPNHIPPFISKDIAVEDFYAFTIPGTHSWTGVPALAVGRIPFQFGRELDVYLDKLKYMESATDGDFSEWRNKVVLISDDDLSYHTIDDIGGGHVEASDGVGATILDSSSSTQITKINLFEYERDGLEKPAARGEVIDALNSGVGLMNYFGHGGFATMGDEKLLNVNDLPSLTSTKRYLMYLAFSCSVGFFDMPGQKALAPALTLAEGRGSIVSMASTRTSYATSNQNFAIRFYKQFYSQSSSNTIGTAIIDAKIASMRYYAIFGDPSYRPLAENSQIDFSLVNSSNVALDTVNHLQIVYISAKIPDTVDVKIDSINVQIEGPEQDSVTRDDGGAANYYYKLPGLNYDLGTFAVVDDSIRVAVEVPMNIAKDSSFFRMYGWCDNSASTITGIYDGFTVDGIDPNADTTDKVGPSIVLQLVQDAASADTSLQGVVGNRVVVDGFGRDSATAYTQSAVELELFFTDTSSIDFSGNGPSQGITIALDGVFPTKNYNRKFKRVGSRSNRGKVRFLLRESDIPQAGEYDLTVTAADIWGNTTQETFVIEVKNTGEVVYDIGDFYAYPSPAYIGGQTRFYFNTPSTTVDRSGNTPRTVSTVNRMTLKIFTLSGQLVRQFNDVQAGVQWDLKDQRGNQLSPNVYLYRLYVDRRARESANGGVSQSENEIIMSDIRKMVIKPPRR